jgi:hypothetical protein
MSTYLGGLRKLTKIFTIADIRARIETDQLLNTSLESYYYNNSIDKVCFSYSSLFFYLAPSTSLLLCIPLFIDFFPICPFFPIYFILYSLSYFIFLFLVPLNHYEFFYAFRFFFQERSKILGEKNLRVV